MSHPTSCHKQLSQQRWKLIKLNPVTCRLVAKSLQLQTLEGAGWQIVECGEEYGIYWRDGLTLESLSLDLFQSEASARSDLLPLLYFALLRFTIVNTAKNLNLTKCFWTSF